MLGAAGVQADIIAVNSAISACATCNRWEWALHVGTAEGLGVEDGGFAGAQLYILYSAHMQMYRYIGLH